MAGCLWSRTNTFSSAWTFERDAPPLFCLNAVVSTSTIPSERVSVALTNGMGLDRLTETPLTAAQTSSPFTTRFRAVCRRGQRGQCREVLATLAGARRSSTVVHGAPGSRNGP
jgi:hypothetical protein